MFIETVTDFNGDTTTGKATEADARHLLTRGVRLICAIEPTTAGGVRIVRTVHRTNGTRGRHTIELTPEQDLSRALTERTSKDLALIDAHPATYRPKHGDIRGSLFRIPPGASRRLLALGLIVRDGDQVRVSLAARLASHALAHRTRIRHADDAPLHGNGSAGHHEPGRGCGLAYDCPAVAACECGWSADAQDFYQAGVMARGHRHEAAAAFVMGAAQ